MRERFKGQEERDVEKMTKVKMGGGKAAAKATAATNGAGSAAEKTPEKTIFPHAFPDDVGSNNSGWVNMYDMCDIVQIYVYLHRF